MCLKTVYILTVSTLPWPSRVGCAILEGIAQPTACFTANCILYGESGTTDMKTKIDTRLVNFWAKLKTGNQDKLSGTMCKLISNLYDQDFHPEYSHVPINVIACDGTPSAIRTVNPSQQYQFNFKWVITGH